MPFTIPLSWLVTPLLALAMAAGGYWSGYRAGDHNRDNAWLALQAQAQAQAHADLQAALARGDRLSNTLLTAEHQISQLRTEVHHALNKTTSGRPCLNGPTVRLLNQASGLAASKLPAATGSAAAGGATVATDPGDSAPDDAQYSTDTQVASWIADAGAAHGVCRARLDALIDWHLEKTKP